MEHVDVIIPLHNGERWIIEAIESVIQQSYDVQQIIVVNDASTDESVQLIKSLNNSSIQIIDNPEPGSAARARNFGLTQSTAPYVAFLDQDDIWHPDHIQMLIRPLLQNPNAPLCASKYLQFTDGACPSFETSNEDSAQLIQPWNNFPFAEYMEPSLILYRRSIFYHFAWSDDTHGGGDIFLWFQIAVQHPLLQIDTYTVARRVHDESYYLKNVQRHPAEYFEKMANLSIRLINFHQQYHPELPGDLAKRTNIMQTLSKIVSAVLDQQVAEFQQLMNTLEEIMQASSKYVRSKTFEHLFIFLTHHKNSISSQMPREQVNLFIYSNTPSQCKLSLREMVTQINLHRPGLDFYRRAILQHPLSLRWINLLYRSLLIRIRHIKPSTLGNVCKNLCTAINFRIYRIFQRKQWKLIQYVLSQKLTYLGEKSLIELSQAVKACDQSQKIGIIVEAGCALGGSAIAITGAKNRSRPFATYDVFGLIPEPSDHDGESVNQRYKQIQSGQAQGINGDIYYGYETDLYKKVLDRFEEVGFNLEENTVSIHQGLFQDTLKLNAPVCLAHIDCDFYEAVKYCLEQIAPNLVTGGIIIVDDYYSWPGCRKAVDEYFKDRSNFVFVKKNRLHIIKQ